MADEEDKSTQRVVLAKRRVLVLPENAHTLAEIDTDALGEPVEAWVVCGTFEGATKKAAIEEYAGKPNTPDAKSGTFKAPTVSAWSGGRHYQEPQMPLVQAQDIE